MFRDDYGILIVVASFLVGLIIFLVLVVNLADNDSWTPAPNGCYVHTHDYNHFGADQHTVNMYCKVK